MRLLKTYASRLLIASVIFLGGCAGGPNSVVLRNEKSEVVREMGVDPVMFSGIPFTENIRTGNFVAVLADFPQTAESYAEWDPLRIRYQAHAVGNDGHEYPAYALFAGFIGAAPRYIVIVEGVTERKADIRILTFSTLLSKAYSLKAEQVAAFDAKKYKDFGSYRAEICAVAGTSLSEARLVTGMRDAIGNWHVYKTKSGPLATPLSESDVKYLAGINPRYGYWEKFTGTARVGLSPDYVSSGIGLVMDFLRASGAESTGFDYESVQPRLRQGYNMTILEAMRQKDVQRMLSQKKKNP